MGYETGEIAVYDVLKGEVVEVEGTGVVYTPVYALKKNVNYSFEIQFAVDDEADIDCLLEVEQGNALPATEGEADDGYVVPDDADPFLEIEDEDLHIRAYCPAVTRYLRLKITGRGDNSATVRLVKFNVCTVVNL